MTDSQDSVLAKIDSLIATVPDFPKPGIQFKDITPLLASSEVFSETIELLAEKSRPLGADLIAAPESRGFLFGLPVAQALGIGFIPIRKPGKLPVKRFRWSMNWNMELTPSK